MRSFISSLVLITMLVLTGCGGSGGGGGSASVVTPPVVTPPPPSGIITFANGVSFNVNDDTSTGRKFSQDTNTTVWQFYTTAGYTLFGYGTQSTFNLDYSFAFDNVKVAGVYVTKMITTYTGGQVETRYLATDTSGNIRLLGVQGSGPGDFMVASISDSPTIFLPAVISVGWSWVGGFSGNDSMNIMEVDVPAPSGPTTELHSIHFRQNAPGGVVTDWWFIKNFGFVNTQRAANGYDRLVGGSPAIGGFTRVPHSNG